MGTISIFCVVLLNFLSGLDILELALNRGPLKIEHSGPLGEDKKNWHIYT